MHVLATKYELCNFNDSTYDLNALIFAFKTGISLCKDVKMYDENFKLKFFFS